MLATAIISGIISRSLEYERVPLVCSAYFTASGQKAPE